MDRDYIDAVVNGATGLFYGIVALAVVAGVIIGLVVVGIIMGVLWLTGVIG